MTMAAFGAVLWLFVISACHWIYANAGEPVVFLPPFELRTISGESSPFTVPVVNSAFQAADKVRGGRILHTSNHPSVQADLEENHVHHKQEIHKQELHKQESHPSQSHDEKNVNVHDLLHALGLEENAQETQEESRAAARDYDYPSYHSSYGYPAKPYYPPQYPPYPQSQPYHEPSYSYAPPTAVHAEPPKISLIKPFEKSELVKPITTKVATKVSGFISLLLALFTGSGVHDLELKGLKDLVINGIIKPLLIAKGGLKSIISKLTIPVISLLLINLEVLLTVWWLWEDCPEPAYPPPAYPYSKPSYNSYR